MRINVFNKRSNYIKDKEIFNYNIFKRNLDKTLSANAIKINTITRILKDLNEEFLIKTKIYINLSQE